MLMSERRPAEIRHNSMAGQQILQIPEHQFDKFPTTSSFLSWKIRFKFSLGCYVMDQSSGDGRFSG